MRGYFRSRMTWNALVSCGFAHKGVAWALPHADLPPGRRGLCAASGTPQTRRGQQHRDGPTPPGFTRLLASPPRASLASVAPSPTEWDSLGGCRSIQHEMNVTQEDMWPGGPGHWAHLKVELPKQQQQKIHFVWQGAGSWGDAGSPEQPRNTGLQANWGPKVLRPPEALGRNHFMWFFLNHTWVEAAVSGGQNLHDSPPPVSCFENSRLTES